MTPWTVAHPLLSQKSSIGLAKSFVQVLPLNVMKKNLNKFLDNQYNLLYFFTSNTSFIFLSGLTLLGNFCIPLGSDCCVVVL